MRLSLSRLALPLLVLAPSGCADSGAEGAEPDVVLVVLDGLDAGAGTPGAMPRLDALARGALVCSVAVPVSVHPAAELASLLTGERPAVHGVRSLADRGQQRLAARHVTLAERYRHAGWRTFAHVALAPLRDSLTGLWRGVEHLHESDGSAAEGRASEDGLASFALRLARALEDPSPVFVAAVLAGEEADADVARRLEPRLGEYRDTHPAIAEALDLAARDPTAGVRALERTLERGRGAGAREAFRRARRDAHADRLDAELGALLDAFDAAGRADGAIVVVAALRPGGDAGLGDGGGAAPLRQRLVVRVPEGEARSVGDPAQAVDVLPTLAAVHGWDLPSDLGGRDVAAASFDPPVAVFEAICWRAALDAAQVIDVRAVSPEHAPADLAATDVPAELAERAERATLALAPFPEWILERGARADSQAAETPSLEVELAVIGESAKDGLAPRASSRSLAPGEKLRVATCRPGAPARLRLVSDAALSREALFAGERSFGDLLLPELAVEGAEDWPKGALPAATLMHDGGGWWRLDVEGRAGEPAEVLVALFPPGDLDERLAAAAGGGVEIERVPGRLDAVRARGTCPFSLRVEKSHGREFALALRVGGRVVPTTEVRRGERRFGSPTELVLYLPDWIPGATDALDRPDAGSPVPAGAVRVARTGCVPPEDRAALSPEELAAVARLGGSW